MTVQPNGIGMTPDLFAAAFPFHFALDHNLHVVQAGASLLKLLPGLEPGAAVLDHMRIVYPDGVDCFDAFCNYSSHLFILQLRGEEVRLRGQQVHLPEADLLLFLGSPWMTDPGEVKRLGLTLNDFALHDPVVDLLQVMQSQSMVLADTRRLADKLTAQRAELATANQALKAEIAERAAAEATLREREMRFHTLLESASEAITLVNEEGLIVLVNERAETLFGYSRAELVGQAIEVLMPDALREVHRSHRGEFMAHPRTRPMGGGLVLTGRRKDGMHLPLEISLSTIPTRQGMLIMTFITDITERRRAADELQSQRDFAQQVMNTMGQGLTVSDARGRYEYVNPAFARMIGQTPNATIGRSILDFAAPEERDRFARSHALLRAGRMVTEEVTLYDVNGRPLPVLLTCVPRLRNNTYLGVITVVTDLAERKQIEQAIEWARDRAIEASRLKSDFLANMSHEIRTPLNSIIGLSEMLGAMPLGQTEREYTEIILESGKALLALIDDILDFSKIEAGKMVLEQRPLDLRQCVEGALDLVSPRALQKGLDLAYLLEDTTPQYIVGDGTRLRQILLNLIGNAVKFTERGEVTLAVRAAKLEPTPTGHKPGDYELHFAVQDTGLGIPQERQERLFQSFSQVDASTTRRYGGTGLGLAISRRLCEAMGGRMWVESSGIPGQGATFHFTIPVQEATDLATGGAVVAPSAARHAGTAGQEAQRRALTGKRLLLILGNQGAAIQWRSLALQAQDLGMQVYFCTSVDEAVEWHVAGKRIDIAVLDYRTLEAGGDRAVQQMTGVLRDAGWLLLAPLGYRTTQPLPARTQIVTTPVKSEPWRRALIQAATGGASSAQPPLERERFDPRLAERAPLRILIVEDNQVNQIVVRRLLERFGYQATSAAGGAEALRLVREQPFDLILMDMQMPEMDGLEATQAIRTLERELAGRGPATIIACTANAQQADRTACLLAGMDDFVTKPVQVEELRRVLESRAQICALSQPAA